MLERLKRWLDKRRANRNNEVWVEIVGYATNEKGQVEIQLDWNNAFIEYLVENGFERKDEYIMVQTWLMGLNAKLIQSIQNNAEKEWTPGKEFE